MAINSEAHIEEKSKKRAIFALLSFLLGLFSATDIFYVFTIGNTHILLSELYAVVLLCILFLFKHIKLSEISHIVPTSMKNYLYIIIFSVMLALINFFDQMSVLSRYFVGMAYLCILLTSVVDVICMFEYRGSILRGIEMGVVINVALCIVQYIAFRQGIIFDALYNTFPQAAFHLNIYNFGAQGLFLEPSHMIQYFGMMMPIILVWEKERARKFLFLTIILGAAVLSAAGSAIILLLALVLYIIYRIRINKNICIHFTIPAILTICFMIIVLAVLLLIGTFDGAFSDIMLYWNLIISGSNITSNENMMRMISIQNVAKLLIKFPLGCGWNMASTAIKQNTLLTTAAAFSDLLEMTLELSIIGVAVYIISLFSVVRRLITTKTMEGIGYTIAIIDIIAMQTMADCSFDIAMFIVFGLAISYLYKFKMRQDDHIIERRDAL